MYVCRRMKLCSYLLSQGFKYVKVEKDKFNEKYNVWIFESSPELRCAIESYYAQKPER